MIEWVDNEDRVAQWCIGDNAIVSIVKKYSGNIYLYCETLRLDIGLEAKSMEEAKKEALEVIRKHTTDKIVAIEKIRDAVCDYLK